MAATVQIVEKNGAGGTQTDKTSGTIREALIATLSGAQSDAAWVSPSLILLHGWDVTLKQTAGTGRVFPWSIRKVA